MVIIEIAVLLLRVYRSGSSGNTSCWFSREGCPLVGLRGGWRA